MSTNQVTVHGQVKPDGTLEVTERVDLPPGPVQVTVEPTRKVPAGEDTRLVLGRIWARRQARGAVARCKEDIDAEIATMRDADEDRMREIEAIGRQPSPKKE